MELLEGEYWLPITGYNYWISNMGRIMNNKQKLLKPYTIRGGYLMIGLHSNGTRFRLYVHRLVMESFVGVCPDGYEVNHIDHNRRNNRVENLEYVTKSQNTIDRLSTQGRAFTFIEKLPEGSVPFEHYGNHVFPADKYYKHGKQLFLKIRDQRYRVLDIRYNDKRKCFILNDINHKDMKVYISKL